MRRSYHAVRSESTAIAVSTFLRTELLRGDHLQNTRSVVGQVERSAVRRERDVSWEASGGKRLERCCRALRFGDVEDGSASWRIRKTI